MVTTHPTQSHLQRSLIIGMPDAISCVSSNKSVVLMGILFKVDLGEELDHLHLGCIWFEDEVGWDMSIHGYWNKDIHDACLVELMG